MKGRYHPVNALPIRGRKNQVDDPTDVDARPLHVRHGTGTGTRRGERRQCSQNGTDSL